MLSGPGIIIAILGYLQIGYRTRSHALRQSRKCLNKTNPRIQVDWCETGSGWGIAFCLTDKMSPKWNLLSPLTRSWPHQGSCPAPLHCPSVETLFTATVSCCGCEGWTERTTWRRAPHPNTSPEDTSGPSPRRSFSANLRSSPDSLMRWGSSKARELHLGNTFQHSCF